MFPEPLPLICVRPNELPYNYVCYNTCQPSLFNYHNLQELTKTLTRVETIIANIQTTKDKQHTQTKHICSDFSETGQVMKY